MLLLQHFPELTRHPFNAEKMMDLVLQLAVQGKLTKKWREEHPDLEPASVLLEKTREEKERLIIDKKIKKERPLSEIDQLPFEKPNSWEWVKLGDLIHMYNGRAFKSTEWSDSGLPIIRIQNLNNSNANFNYYNGKLDFRHKVDKGTFLISWSGTPGTSFGAFIWQGPVGALNQHINKCEFYSELTFDQFYKATINSQLNELIRQAQGGVGLKHVTKGILNNLVLPLPPLEEQKEIVRIVDQLKEEVDSLNRLSKERLEKKHQFVVSSLHHLTESGDQKHWNLLQDNFTDTLDELDNVKKLRETILQLAVQGKLTQKWREANPDVEPAVQLLQHIQEEKEKLIAEKKIKKEKPLPPILDDEIPYELPGGWEWVRLQSLLSSIRYGTSKKCDYGLGNTGILRIPNLINGEIDVQDLKSTDLTIREIQDLDLQRGDLLIIRSNGSESLVGTAAIIRGEMEGFAFAGYLMRLRLFTSYIESSYLVLNMKSRFIRDSIEKPIRTTSGVKNINSTEVSSLLISLPPYEEQKAIVQQVDRLMSLCDDLEAHIRKRNETAEKLMRAVVVEIFAKTN